MPNIRYVLTCKAAPSLGNLSCLLNFLGLFVMLMGLFIVFLASTQKFNKAVFTYIGPCLTGLGLLMLIAGILLFFQLRRLYRQEQLELSQMDQEVLWHHAWSGMTGLMLNALPHAPPGPGGSGWAPNQQQHANPAFYSNTTASSDMQSLLPAKHQRNANRKDAYVSLGHTAVPAPAAPVVRSSRMFYLETPSSSNNNNNHCSPSPSPKATACTGNHVAPDSKFCDADMHSLIDDSVFLS